MSTAMLVGAYTAAVTGLRNKPSATRVVKCGLLLTPLRMREVLNGVAASGLRSRHPLAAGGALRTWRWERFALASLVLSGPETRGPEQRKQPCSLHRQCDAPNCVEAFLFISHQ